MSKTGKVGAVCGMPIPPVNSYLYGYKAGVETYDYMERRVETSFHKQKLNLTLFKFHRLVSEYRTFSKYQRKIQRLFRDFKMWDRSSSKGAVKESFLCFCGWINEILRQCRK